MGGQYSVMSTPEFILLLTLCSAVTFSLRAAPFILFGRKQPPDVVLYLGRVLPPAIMAMLVIYCLKDITLFSGNFGLPEIIACLAVVGLHIWRKNTLISIFAGTIIYMILVQFIFV